MYDSSHQKQDVKTSHQTLEIGSSLPQSSDEVVKPTLKRYAILLLFALNLGNKTFQWMQIPASTTKATAFYGVENYVINFASIIFMLSLLLISWPACYVIERIGIRKGVLFASFGTVLGSLVKCLSCHPDRVALLLLGQVIVSLSEQLVVQVPARIASLWFPDSQVSSSVSICMFGNQLGIAFGFLVPQLLMRDAETSDQIGAKFYQLFLITLALSTGLFVANWLLFDDAPKNMPGLARQRQFTVEQGVIKETFEPKTSLRQLAKEIMRLGRNRDLILIAISFGLSYGRLSSFATLLDQTIKPIFPDEHTLVGTLGFILVLSGALSAPLWGRLIDKVRAYKMINLAFAICTTLSFALFAYGLIYLHSIRLLYLAGCLLGFFQSIFYLSAMDYAMEITYPASEMITSSIVFVMPATLGPSCILIGSYVVDNYGALSAHLFYVATVAISLICVLSCRGRLNRQEAIVLQATENKHKAQI